MYLSASFLRVKSSEMSHSEDEDSPMEDEQKDMDHERQIQTVEEEKVSAALQSLKPLLTEDCFKAAERVKDDYITNIPQHSEHLSDFFDRLKDNINSLQDSHKGKKKKPNQQGPVKVFTVVDGQTFNADKVILDQVRKSKHGVETTKDPNECDFIIVFCPITSRVGSDVEEAMENIPGTTDGKPVILVLMHHTRKDEYSTGERAWSDDKERRINNVQLVVHVLYHETKPGLLRCQQNDQAVRQIQEELKKHCKSTTSRVSTLSHSRGPVKVFLAVNGRIFDADKVILDKVTKHGVETTKDPNECDFIIVFCPITSRFGSDVEEAMGNIPGTTDGKPVILVLMHHTRKDEYSTGERAWSDDKERRINNVQLVVHVLYHETKPGLLRCQQNDQAVRQIQEELKKHCKSTTSRVSTLSHSRGPVKVFLAVNGRIFDADKVILDKVTKHGVETTKDPNECDFIIVFCPITSRFGSDVEEAMGNIPGTTDGKPVILVLMHHTRKEEYSTGEIKQSVYGKRGICVHMVVHVLYHETQPGLLSCQRNEQAVRQIQEELKKYCKSSWWSLVYGAILGVV